MDLTTQITDLLTRSPFVGPENNTYKGFADVKPLAGQIVSLVEQAQNAVSTDRESRLRRFHQPRQDTDRGQICCGCYANWPCPTITILDTDPVMV